jgi:hypothetical protein
VLVEFHSNRNSTSHTTTAPDTETTPTPDLTTKPATDLPTLRARAHTRARTHTHTPYYHAQTPTMTAPLKKTRKTSNDSHISVSTHKPISSRQAEILHQEPAVHTGPPGINSLYVFSLILLNVMT